jgi:signal transduction histidine kinase
MHQVKNPLQALRTYGKLLQQQLADMDKTDYYYHSTGKKDSEGGKTRKLLELADHLMIQGDRLTARLQPVDAILDEYTDSTSSHRFALMPSSVQPNDDVSSTSSSSSVDPQRPQWSIPLLPLPEQQVPSSANALSYASVTQAMGASSSVLRDFDVEMTFVADVLTPILDSFHAIAQDQGIRFDVEIAAQYDDDVLPGVMANAEALQEAVSNVIDNAIKYVKFPKPDSGLTANPTPRVKVSLQPNPIEDNEGVGVTILIEDNGPGIPQNSQELVFQRGFRHDTTKRVGGSGIGLDIARTLVEKMGGSLDILTTGQDENDDAFNGARLQVKLYRQPKLLGRSK